MELSGSEHGGVLAARALKECGVTTIFALPGGHILPLFEGARREGIRIIDTRHEEGAAMAGVGWALASGEPGVVAVTAGPGVTNAIPGLAEAHAFGAPVVLMAGRTAFRQHNRGAVQDLPQLRLVEPITKWQATCHETARVGDYVREALHRARAGKPGPTFLEIPQDVMGNAAVEPTRPFRFGYPDDVPRAAPRAADLERALDLLASAERPLVVAGGGAFWSGAGEVLAAFCERSGIPVTTTSAARGLVPDDHPRCLGGLVHGGIALASSDVALVLGSAFNANLVYGGLPLFPPDGAVIQVDVRAEQVGGNRRPDLALAADVRTFLEAATEAWTAPADRFDEWTAKARDGVASSLRGWEQQTEASTARLHPGWVARETARFAAALGPHTFACDGGDSLVWGLAFARVAGPGRHPATGSALGTLGVGLPFALAARAARPREPVFLFTGDGAFGLTAMELDTCARHGLPVVVVVVNNGGWGDVRHEQRAMYGAEADVGAILSELRYDLLAQAVGGYGETVERAEDLRPALQRAVDAGIPAVLNVLCEAEVMSELMRNLAALDVM
ncbi:MAG TPA: thiamine pyrophosphate-binding protein [Actinomycetota bacterium]|nr:thiamine pyrophosphate-binding protein [Actinomycetota bacterium]